MNGVSTVAVQIVQIVWINILLSGDNAVVIALACRSLAPSQRRWAIAAGSGVAVGLRILFTVFIVQLLQLPYVKLVGALLLLWIAFDLLRQQTETRSVAAAGSVWAAVRTIAIADAVMSLDNVVAVAAAARNSVPLIAFGVAVSVPLVVFGSTLMLRLLKRFPILVVAGAALLGWVAGEMLASEPELARWFGSLPGAIGYGLAGAGAALVLAFAGLRHLIRRWRSPLDRPTSAPREP